MQTCYLSPGVSLLSWWNLQTSVLDVFSPRHDSGRVPAAAANLTSNIWLHISMLQSDNEETACPAALRTHQRLQTSLSCTTRITNSFYFHSMNTGLHLVQMDLWYKVYKNKAMFASHINICVHTFRYAWSSYRHIYIGKTDSRTTLNGIMFVCICSPNIKTCWFIDSTTF